MSDLDTIVALATAPGEAALGIVRLSGPRTNEVMAALLHPTRALVPRTATFAQFRHPATGGLLDEGVVTVYARPHSYTGEDLAEISAHGNPIVLAAIVEACLACDARKSSSEFQIRPAQPGEFTLRAYLNGKLTLDQAEAVADLIVAKTDLAARAALDQLCGRLGNEVHALQTGLVQLMTHLEASLDFPDDELEPWTLSEQLAAGLVTLEHLNTLRASYDHGRLLRDGLHVVIAGRPNVGKSSLLNALLRRDRAIVTPMPGTTRDTLEEWTNLRGVPVRLTDTAGLRAASDEVERLGLDRARAAINAADLVLLVLDGSQPLSEEDEGLLQTADPMRTIIAVNKCDLPRAGDSSLIPHPSSLIEISALTGLGLDQLETAIAKRAVGPTAPGHEVTITRLRHKEALDRAAEALTLTLQALEDGLPADVATIPLRDCLHALGEITGEKLVEQALHAIFSEFCIGK